MSRGLARKSVSLLGKLTLLLVVSFMMLAACELVVRAFVTVRNVGPSFTMYSPIYGKQLRPSISVTRTTPEFTMRFSTNAQGFRQPDEVPLGSGPILFLGDSFTMGYGVDDGDEFVALIRARKPPSEGPFLNAAMGNNGNGRWLKFLTREARDYRPQLVVLQVMDNDFDDNPAEGLFELSNGELVELPVPPPGPQEWMQSAMSAFPLLVNSHLVGLLRQVRWPRGTTRANPSATDRSQDPDQLTFRLVDRAIAICQEQGWPVLGLSVGLHGERLKRMRRLFDDRQVRLLEAPSRKSHPELYYEIDGHWNAEGHAHIAELVMEALP